MLDQSGVSTAAACKVLRELLLALSNKKHNIWPRRDRGV